MPIRGGAGKDTPGRGDCMMLLLAYFCPLFRLCNCLHIVPGSEAEETPPVTSPGFPEASEHRPHIQCCCPHPPTVPHKVILPSDFRKLLLIRLVWVGGYQQARMQVHNYDGFISGLRSRLQRIRICLSRREYTEVSGRGVSLYAVASQGMTLSSSSVPPTF